LKKLKLKKSEKSPEVKKLEKTKLKINNSLKTVIIKNLTDDTNEEILSNFIKEEEPSLELEDIRIVKDRNGKSRGFAFIDFTTPKMANRFVKIINHKILNENTLFCAISKPPSLG
jgi:RNA recognition motif-containing protein